MTSILLRVKNSSGSSHSRRLFENHAVVVTKAFGCCNINRTASSLTASTTTSSQVGHPELHPSSSSLRLRVNNNNKNNYGRYMSSTTKATSYSSFQEPDPLQQLFDSSPVGEDGMSTADTDSQLRADIRAMGTLLGTVMQQHHGSDLFDKVETMRKLAKKWREESSSADVNVTTDDESFQSLIQFASNLSNKELFTVSRAFTHFLGIVNAAEQHHRVRRIKEVAMSNTTFDSGALYPKDDSCGGVIPNLLSKGISPQDIYTALTTQTTELVLTAHPTEVNRRTILDKKRRIQDILTSADQYRSMAIAQQALSSGTTTKSLSGLQRYEMEQMQLGLAREISSIWLSDEVARFKPTVEQEAEKGTLILETVLWEAVPQFLRKLDSTVQDFLGQKLPLTCSPIKFASWMGGDRDGNPNVLPNTTRIVCLKNRMKAAQLFYNDVRTLRSELSITETSTTIQEFNANIDVHNTGTFDEHEPFRVALNEILRKLSNTQEWAQYEIDKLKSTTTGITSSSSSNTGTTKVFQENDIYLHHETFRNDLMIVYNSLIETNNELIADGFLTDVLRNVSAFGLTLIPLDVRQESGRHDAALDAITRYLGLGSYMQWDEQTRINWLTSQIASKRPLIRSGVWYEDRTLFNDTIIDTLETFQMIAEQHEGSLGAYVISQATSASDVLAVLLLQIDAGVKKPLRVAPLFETLGDLQGAVDTMKQLFALPTYVGMIHGKQEVMIGYSDSAKDAGRLAASWAQYKTQVELATVARQHNIDMTFFHGKGGTVGRGGNPQTYHAIMAHAPQTINGYFRVTEQGEMITQNFGYSDTAERTLDIYTAAVLAEKLTPRQPVKSTWIKMMDELSTISCNAYRAIVRDDSRFVPYFREATPDFSNLNIGSRPAKRNPTGGVESLRAIPWNFAWTQTRFNLPTWLGVGEAIHDTLQSTDDEQSKLIREMYHEFDTFRTMVDLVEMVLAKSEPSIAKHYEDMLVHSTDAKELGTEVRTKHLQTVQAIKELTGHTTLAENNKILTRALHVKNPYVDCLNVLQAETIKRMRVAGNVDEDLGLKDALTTTITGIANGMGNTG